MSNYDLIVIGAGPGGYTAAIRASQLGMKVAIVERDLIGGICINWGCTPSKAMISSAKYAKYIREARSYGIYLPEAKLDFNQLVLRRDEVVANSRAEIKALLEHWQVDLIHGAAHLISANTVLVNSQNYYAKFILLATGSQPIIPPFLQKEDSSIVSSNHLTSIKRLPKELTIVGGGVIGIEFATIFANLGSKVRIVEMADRILSLLDTEISAELTKQLTNLGVEVLTSHKVLDISEGRIQVENPVQDARWITSPLNLIAIGRRAVFAAPELEALKIQYNPQGVVTNLQMQTSLPNVYAVGDVTGHSVLAHVAIQQAVTAAEHMCGRQIGMNYNAVPAVIYSLPEIASVGLQPNQDERFKIIKFPFTANLRANIEGHNEGFAKIWIDVMQNKLVGAQIIGENASELIQQYGNLIALNIPLTEVIKPIYPHPTYSEIVRSSIQIALDCCIEYSL